MNWGVDKKTAAVFGGALVFVIFLATAVSRHVQEQRSIGREISRTHRFLGELEGEPPWSY